MAGVAVVSQQRRFMLTEIALLSPFETGGVHL
jgi:hypothetical protein